MKRLRELSLRRQQLLFFLGISVLVLAVIAAAVGVSARRFELRAVFLGLLAYQQTAETLIVQVDEGDQEFAFTFVPRMIMG